MALGNLRQFADFQSDEGVFYTLEIYDETWSGSSTEFSLGSDGFTLDWTGKNKKRWSPIHASSCTFTYYSQDATDATFMTSALASEQGSLRIKIKRGTSASPTDVFWVGTILTDTTFYFHESQPRKFKFKAVCGLSLLKGVDFNKSWGINNGSFHSLRMIIQRMLLFTNSIEFYADDDEFFRTCVNWREDTMATAGTNFDPLALSAVYPYTLWTSVANGGEVVPRSAYFVLEDICKCFGARIYYSNGMWNFIQPDIYPHMPVSGVNGKYWIYQLDGDLDSHGTFEDESYTVNNSDIYQLFGRKSTALPALRQVDFTYSNWGPGVFNTTIPTFYSGEVAAVYTEIGYVVSGLDITILLYDNGLIDQTSGTLYDDCEAYLHIFVKIVTDGGTSYYLQDDYTFSTDATGYVTTIANLWDSSFDPGSGGFAPDTQVVIHTETGFTTTQTGVMSIKIEHYIADYWDGTAVTQSFFTGTDLYFTGVNGAAIAYTVDNPDLYEIGRVFRTVQSTNNANVDFDLGETLLGDGPYQGSPGNIRVNDGSSWSQVPSEDWTSFGTGDPERITAVASRDYLAGQNKGGLEVTDISCLHTSSELFDFTKLYVVDGKDFIVNKGKFFANKDVFKGELIETYFEEQSVISSDFTETVLDNIVGTGIGNPWDQSDEDSNPH
mgnify:CR=1 FL=1